MMVPSERRVGAAKVLLRKARSLLDRPYSWCEIRESGLPLRAPLTYEERIMLRELQGVLTEPKSIVFDIGASQGVYTAMFAKVGTVAGVYAFEPSPKAFAALTKRVGRFSHVECFDCALGDVNETKPFHEYSYSETSSFLPMEPIQVSLLPDSTTMAKKHVEVRRLDDLVAEGNLPYPDIVKMDVQGYEDRVLVGGESSVRRARWCVLEMSFVSMYRGSLLFDDMYGRMRGLGFRLAGFAGPVAGPLGSARFVDGIFRREGAPDERP